MKSVTVTPNTIQSFIKEAKAKKLLPQNIPSFFLQFFGADSLNEFDEKEIQIANEWLPRYRLPTVDGSHVPLHSTQEQGGFLRGKVGN